MERCRELSYRQGSDLAESRGGHLARLPIHDGVLAAQPPHLQALVDRGSPVGYERGTAFCPFQDLVTGFSFPLAV